MTAITGLLALATTAIQNAALRFWFATPSRWLRGTIAAGAQKHHGFGDPSIRRRSSRAQIGQRLFYAHALRMAHMAFLFGGPCGDTRKGVPVPSAGSPTPHGLPSSFGDGGGRFSTCSEGAIMANTPQGRTAPASPTHRATLRTDASSALALAAFHHRKGNHTAAARQAVLALKVLRKLQAFEATSASPCTNCPDNRPLPSGPLDFFDTPVVAFAIERRTACTLCPTADKPCLKGGAA